jgi:hypothetical protein
MERVCHIGGYSIHLTADGDMPMSVDFSVYETIEDSTGKYWYLPEDGVAIDFTLDSPVGAEVFMSGFLKWDGCHHFTFPAQDSCMLHICGLNGWESFNKMIEKLYETAGEMMQRDW